jgi:uncharacterized protein YfaS (alpha-2-macroglobulin family)
MNSAPTRFLSRPLALVFLVMIAAAAVLWLQPGGARNVSIGAQLLLNTQELEPATTFEVRFDEAMVEPERVGFEAPLSPLVIQPTIPGKFVWLSRRSGVFTPTESPVLASRYTVRLRDGLKTAAGEPLMAALEQHFATPAFECRLQQIARFDPTSAPAAPEFTLVFSDDAATNAVGNFIRYRDEAGHSIPAEIQVGETWSDAPWESPGGETSWSQRFPRPQPTNTTISLKAGRVFKPHPAPNIIHIAPAHPLPPGKGWRLVVESGIPSANGAHRTAASMNHLIGDVLPFRVTAISAANNLNYRREVRVYFNKSVNAELLATNALDWVRVEPPVPNLNVHVAPWGGLNISLAGEFGLGTNYHVTVRAGFPAREDFTLAELVTSNIVFTPLDPQVYLPTYSGENLASGRREFEFLTLNCAKVRLNSKRLDADQLIHALRGYRGYTSSGWKSPKAHAVDYNAVAGVTAFETMLQPELIVDATVRHKITWDKLLGGHKFGAALVQVEQGAAEANFSSGTVAQSLVQLTDLGLLWKQSTNETLVWCFSYANGEPVPGATIRLSTDESECLAQRTTDAAGFARLPAPEKAMWLMAEKGDDLHALELGGHKLYGPWNSTLPSWDTDQEDKAQMRGLLFTERDVYQPGDTVMFKAILRRLRDGQAELPEPAPFLVTCVAPGGVEIFNTNLTASALGSLDAAIPLPVAPCGSYLIHLSGTNVGKFSKWFTVAEYEPNAYEVKVEAKKEYPAGEPVEIPVLANYFMGKALSNARLRWEADTRDETFKPEGFNDFQFGINEDEYSPISRDERADSAMTLEGELALDAGGKAIIKPEVPINRRFPQPRRVELLAEVTDANQQTISTEREFVRHASDYYLGAKMEARVVGAGEPAPVTVIAVNADGTPRTGPVLVQVTLKRIDYRTVRLQGAGKSAAYRNEREETVVLQTNVFAVGLTNLGSKWDVAPGAIPAMIRADGPGSHLLELRARDPKGHDMLTALPLEVSGEAVATWERRSDTLLELVPDRKSYQAGQTARLLVKTPVSGPALVTVERDQVLRHFNVDLQGSMPVVEVPLTDLDAPNVFVSVMMLRGANQNPHQSKLPDYHYGYCMLEVSSRATMLDVSVQPERTEYRPGEAVKVAALIKDGNGAPIRDAEVTLYAVDEGVLSLTGYQRPDPHAFFQSKLPIQVSTGLSIDRLDPENPEEARFSNKGFVIGGGGRERQARNNFLACAFWSAALRSDGAGSVTVDFKAPDNLTRFRIFAVAHTAKQFGSGESGFAINKPLMLEPSLPRFANIGDEIVLRALIHNQSPHAGEVQVELALDDRAVFLDPADGEKAGTRSRTVALAPGQSIPMEFPVRFTQAGPAKWTWRARFADPTNGNFTDAVESKLAVGHPQPLLRETYLGHIQSGSLDLLAGANPQLLEGRGTIKVSVANTRLVHLSGSIPHLLHYPYGCAEQTSSSLLPWILLDDMPGISPDNLPGGMDRDHALRLGFARLSTMITAKDGLAYWPGGEEPMLAASAYGGLVLALAEKRGMPVPQTILTRVMKYLTESCKGAESQRDTDVLSDYCFALLALAVGECPKPDYHEVLFRKRDLLTAESRAALALAILYAKGPKEMAAELLDSKAVKRETGFGWFGCEERTAALRLAALCRLRPESPEIDTAVAELMKSQQGGLWGTTQGNAWALFALTQYAKLVEGAVDEARAGITFGDITNGISLTKERPVAQFTYELQPGDAPHLRLQNPGGKRLFTAVTLETRSALKDPPRQDRGLGISRRYEVLQADGRLVPFKKARVGDTVVVTLTLDAPQAAHFLAVDDALPAVFEAVNPEFKTQRTRADALAADWMSDFHEIRTDRMQFFRDHLPAGRYTITYSARVRAAGTAAAPGAKVEEMYHPERFGFSGTEHVTTEAAN